MLLEAKNSKLPTPSFQSATKGQYSWATGNGLLRSPRGAANRDKYGNAAGNDVSLMRKIVLLFGVFALTDCAAQSIYLRTDGQDIASNPALRRQLELDRVTCQTEPGDDQDCMAVKGYVSVPKDQAAAKQQQLAAIAAQNAERETVSGLPAPRSTTSPKSATGKKQKSKSPDITPTPSQN
jgi:hypothetical protein